MPVQTIRLIGFGSQGSAWAQCLQSSGWNVQIYLGKTGKSTGGSSSTSAGSGRSYDAAQKLGFRPYLLKDLPQHLSSVPTSETNPHWVAMLCPDGIIAPIYRDYIQSCASHIRLILAHGYVVYANELNLNGPQHRATLLAPKAIGPKLLQNYQNAASTLPGNSPRLEENSGSASQGDQFHSLAAAFWAAPADQEGLKLIARGLGFALSSLIDATFEQETIGDLISEQGLLCGGVFNLLELTMNSMQKAGIPEALIREECITELELVAGLIRERGLAQGFQAISQAAQCGTASMANELKTAGIQEIFEKQAAFIQSREFVGYFRSQKWQGPIRQFTERLLRWEERFKALDLKQ